MQEFFSIMIDAVSAVGFPIACVVAMFYMWDKERAEHKEESKSWTEALQNNTIVMNQILEAVRQWKK